jgi:phosphoglycerate dehydrogenase-like enzyme
MQVIGVRRRAPEVATESGVELHGVDALPDLLPRADVLHCVLPGTPHTTGLIGAREFALLPARAIVVNVGRGEVIDEEALFNALRDRRIRAAGIDVWYNYPHSQEERSNTLPSRFPFHELDNVVLSPHRAGWLSAAEDKRLTMLAELLNAAAAGQPMPSKVDKELGY